MKPKKMSRRDALKGTGALAATAAAASLPRPARAEEKVKSEFRFCLNMSTIRGQKLKMEQDIDIAAEAGYQCIEPWIGKIDQYVKSGGTIKDLDKRIRDKGLTVEDAIAFPEWIVDDDARRAKGLEEAKRCMDIVMQLGCKRIAAPPAGATDKEMNPLRIAERYRALLEVGDKIGVTPMAELWGFSKTMCRVGETAMVAAETGHAKACVLLDVYHIYKGGSDFNSVRLFSPMAMQIFHMNDYPAAQPREKIGDAHRVYPGDGDAPLVDLFRTLRTLGFNGVLSLELFNPDYWKQDALLVAKTGLEKMKAAVAKSA